MPENSIFGKQNRVHTGTAVTYFFRKSANNQPAIQFWFVKQIQTPQSQNNKTPNSEDLTTLPPPIPMLPRIPTIPTIALVLSSDSSINLLSFSITESFPREEIR